MATMTPPCSNNACLPWLGGRRRPSWSQPSNRTKASSAPKARFLTATYRTVVPKALMLCCTVRTEACTGVITTTMVTA